MLHTSGGYLVYVTYTFACVFDYREEVVFWCRADVGWVTGHSYIVYGPLSNGATSLMFEGVPNFPDNSRFWRVVDKHQVTIFYTAPTAIRALMRDGDAPVQAASRKSLRLLGSVGEPINPEAWEWYHRVVGDGRCPIVDTWWQTETGGILISPLPGATLLKAGSATLPLPGIQRIDHGKILERNRRQFVLLDSWPGQMRTVYGDQRFIHTYAASTAAAPPAMARHNKDGYWWITGRVDDDDVSGHRIGTASRARSSRQVARLRWSLPARHQGPGHLRLRDAEERRATSDRCARTAQWVAGLARSPSPTTSSGRRGWKTRSARSCAGSCARSTDEHEHLGDTST